MGKKTQAKKIRLAAKVQARFNVAYQIKLWLVPNPEEILEQHTFDEITEIMDRMRQEHFESKGKLRELSDSRLQELLTLARSVKARKIHYEKNF
jgi:hypothetical protein